MKRKNRRAAWLSGLLALAMLAGLAGCAAKNTETDGGVLYSGEPGNIDYEMTDNASAPQWKADSEPEEGYPGFNTEEYGSITENPFMSVKSSPLSTFSADVDTASYANIRRMLSSGSYPLPEQVRIEEMLNYFTYDYPQPAGEEPFSVTTEIGPCPWNAQTKLMLIGLQAKKVDMEDAPLSNLVFLIDVSGSMDEPNKLPLVKQAFLLLTEEMRPQDRISIVTYASQQKVVLEGATGEDKDKIMTAIENLTAGGATAGSKGIQTAYEIGERFFIEGGNNRIILATDGDLNVGVTSEGALKRLVEEEREKGIFLSVLGFGMGNIKDNKMETLADNGNGNYAYIDTILEAKKVLVEEMGGTLFTVAKDVKLQVEFNPEKIKGYRLIGYENRMLAAEDFADDKKDAGEIGAGHRVTALYELVEADSEFEINDAELKYQKTETVGSEDWLTVNIRYKEPDGDESRLLTYPVAGEAAATDNLTFAAAVAETGLLIRNSQYKGEATYEQVITALEGVEGLSEDVYKDEFLYLVKKLSRMEK